MEVHMERRAPREFSEEINVMTVELIETS